MKSLIKIYLSILLISAFSVKISARELLVSLFHEQQVTSVMFTSLSGEYEIVTGDSSIIRILKNEIIQFSINDSSIAVNDISRNLGSYKFIEIRSRSRVNSFRIKPVQPSLDARNYEGDLIIKSGINLLLINRVELESYIGGVVEAEGGPVAPLEYYKSQALLSRTYALGHFNRHDGEGFHLCDGVHCQAFHGIAGNNADIGIACAETAGQIIVDADNKIITAAYHSNCGGETVNSEDAWTLPLPYLKSITEDYCKQAPHSKWEAIIESNKWKEYLISKGFKNIENFLAADFRYMQNGRQTYYILGNDSVKLKDIRVEWGFKSTYFSIYPVDNDLYFKGIGYGHGVGLCQEGAINMARNGKTYTEILQHYFKGVKIIKL